MAGTSGHGGGEVVLLNEEVLGQIQAKFGLEGEQAKEMAAFVSQMMDKTAQVTAVEASKKFEEEKRKEEERRKEEKRKRAAIPPDQLSPVNREKALKRKQREEVKSARREEREREKKRKLKPLLDLTPAGAPASSSYFEFRSNLAMVVKANFKRCEFWSKTLDGKPRSEEEKRRIIEQVRDNWSNGARICEKVIADRISVSLRDKRNHVREYMRKYLNSNELLAMTPEEIQEKGAPTDGKIDPDCWKAWFEEEMQMRYWIQNRLLTKEIDQLQAINLTQPSLDGEEKLREIRLLRDRMRRHAIKCGDPPKVLIEGYKRAEARGNKATHRLGQGGSRRFKGDFVSPLPSSSSLHLLSFSSWAMPSAKT
jgi:hypothetical protein